MIAYLSFSLYFTWGVVTIFVVELLLLTEKENGQSQTCDIFVRELFDSLLLSIPTSLLIDSHCQRDMIHLLTGNNFSKVA